MIHVKLTTQQKQKAEPREGAPVAVNAGRVGNGWHIANPHMPFVDPDQELLIRTAPEGFVRITLSINAFGIDLPGLTVGGHWK
ncbi:MAG TPA: hypothetical protein VD978_35440 [Azospirillum sp.]|nr:hypothetical protein [Azospirillum sp.]